MCITWGSIYGSVVDPVWFIPNPINPTHVIKHTLKLLFYFTLQSYVTKAQNQQALNYKKKFTVSALSFLLDPEQFIPDPDPGKSSFSDRIRIRFHNTDLRP